LLNSDCSVVSATLLDEYGSRPYLFRSYKVRAEEENDEMMTAAIWEVARATAAAPALFRPTKIKGRKFRDGGMEADNPTAQVMQEVRRVSNATKSSETGRLPQIFGAIVNLGNGPGNPSFLLRRRSTDPSIEPIESKSRKTHIVLPTTSPIPMKRKGPKTALLKRNIEADSSLHPKPVDEAALSTLKEKSQSEVQPLPFFRFDLGEERLPSAWEAGQFDLNFIQQATSDYLATDHIRKRLEDVAKRLVSIRRLRAAKDYDRWIKFAYDEPPFHRRVMSWPPSNPQGRVSFASSDLVSAGLHPAEFRPPARAKTEDGRGPSNHGAPDERLIPQSIYLVPKCFQISKMRSKLAEIYPINAEQVQLVVFSAGVSVTGPIEAQTSGCSAPETQQNQQNHEQTALPNLTTPPPSNPLSLESDSTHVSKRMRMILRVVTRLGNSPADSNGNEWVLIFYFVPPKESLYYRRKKSVPNPWESK
jgi:Patatin-like phospholipase